MSTFKSFERNALHKLGGDTLTRTLVERLDAEGELVSLDFTGVGYFLTLRHRELPVERTVLDAPAIKGKAGELLTGFIAFVENNELTLECFSYGGEAVPENYRELDVTIFA